MTGQHTKIQSAPGNLLVIHGSARRSGSVTRTITDDLLDALRDANPSLAITERDLLDGMPLIDEAWVNANFTPPEDRDGRANAALAFSDQLVEELEVADTIVIASPIYNFGVPAALKAWVDQVARARKTFQYTDQGPVGLLKNKQAVIITASGGTQIGSDIDFATDYLRHVLGFIGISDVYVIGAGQQMVDPGAAARGAEDDFNRVIEKLTQN